MKAPRSKNTPSLDFYELFKHAGSDISPIKFKNQSQYVQELDTLAEKIDERKDWDVQVDAIKKVMGLINGGALEYDQFVRNLIKLSVGLVSASKNLRSTLVKSSCLLISQLARELGNRFDIMGEMVYPLSSQTSHGTQIIADSCKYAILIICKYCQTKRVIGSIIELAKVKSQNNRLIASESILIILNNWKKNIIEKHFDCLSQTVQKLLKDPNPDARLFARRSSIAIRSEFPKRKDEFFDNLDEKTKKQIDEEAMTDQPSSIEENGSGIDNKNDLNNEVNQTSNKKEIEEVHNSESKEETAIISDDISKETVFTQKSTVPQEIIAPEETVSKPEETAFTPEETVSAQQETVSAQQKTVSAQQETVSTPEETVPVQEKAVSSQQETVPVQQETVSTQGETALKQENSLNMNNNLTESDQHRNESQKLVPATPLCVFNKFQKGQFKTPEIESLSPSSTSSEYECHIPTKNIQQFVEEDQVISISDFDKIINSSSSNCVESNYKKDNSENEKDPNGQKNAKNVNFVKRETNIPQKAGIKARSKSPSTILNYNIQKNNSPSSNKRIHSVKRYSSPLHNKKEFHYRSSRCSLSNQSRIKLVDGQEIVFINKVSDCLNMSKRFELQESIKYIVPGLTVCSVHDDKKVSSRSLQLILELLPQFPTNFEKSLSYLLEIIFSDLITDDSVKVNIVPSIVREIQALYSPNLLLAIAARQVASEKLVKFVSLICNNEKTDLTDDELCCSLIKIAMTKCWQQNSSEIIIKAVAKQNKKIIEKIKLDYPKNEVLLNALETMGIPSLKIPLFNPLDVKAWVNNIKAFTFSLDDKKWEKERNNIFSEISNSILQTNQFNLVFQLIYEIMKEKGCGSYDIFLLPLLKYYRNRRAIFVSKIFDFLKENVTLTNLVNSLIVNIKSDDLEVTRSASLIIGQIIRSDESQRTKDMLPDITDNLKCMINNSNPDIRRFSVKCFVDLYSKYGTEIQEYEKSLTSAQQKLLHLYYSKDQVAC